MRAATSSSTPELRGQTEDGELPQPVALIGLDADVPVGLREVADLLHATAIVVSIEVGDREKEPERSPAQRKPAPDLEVETVIRREAFFVARSQDRSEGPRAVGVLHRLGLD